MKRWVVRKCGTRECMDVRVGSQELGEQGLHGCEGGQSGVVGIESAWM